MFDTFLKKAFTTELLSFINDSTRRYPLSLTNLEIDELYSLLNKEKAILKQKQKEIYF